MTHLKWLTLVLVLSGSVALAHQGVQNAAVKARMHAMTKIGAGMKILGKMAKGETGFDSAAARAAAREISTHAAQTEALFTPRESDPKSEAKPAIWEDFDDFTAKAQTLEVLARSLAGGLRTEADLSAAVPKLGAACKACHSKYRE